MKESYLQVNFDYLNDKAKSEITRQEKLIANLQELYQKSSEYNKRIMTRN